MPWAISLSKRAAKQKDKLPAKVQQALLFLLHEILRDGPVRGDWPNYGKPGPRRHHCHIRKGRPTYVAVWEVSVDQVQLVEVTYVGTHEKAPY